MKKSEAKNKTNQINTDIADTNTMDTNITDTYLTDTDHNKPVIKRITWDRMWIEFFISGVNDEDVYIENVRNSYKQPLTLPIDDTGYYISPDKAYGNGIKVLRLNITNPGDCRMLPLGVYNLTTSSGEKIQLSEKIDAKLLNRRFIYFHNEREYRVQFSGRNGFKIKTSDIIREDISTLQRVSSFIRRSKYSAAKKILKLIYNCEYLFFHRKGNVNVNEIKNPRILLMSDISEEMGSNMAALKHALMRKGYKPDELLRAITTKHYSIIHWIKSLKKIATADFIFLDDHSQTTDWLKIKGSVVTQLWHAGAGFKSTGYSRFGMPASPAPVSGHRRYDYGIAGSKKIRHFFSEVWGINDDMVLPTGMPRLDEYLDEEYRKETTRKLLKTYPILCKPSLSVVEEPVKRDNIILFAPTYRGENKKDAYYPYDMLDMDRLYEVCRKTHSIIIFKMHPFVSEPVPIPAEYKDRMLDLGSYPNINDLFYITDLLITDYSSNIYEFSLMRKPMLFYAYDIDEYTKERGFHRDYRRNVPGKIAETFDSMIDAIVNNDYEYNKVEEYISNNFDHTDTHACDRVIDWIIKGNLPTN